MYFSSGITDSVKKVIENASKIAYKFSSSQVGTEHILYGLTTVSDCASSKILEDFGVTKEKLLSLFEENNEAITFLGGTITVELTPSSKEIFKVAQNLAMQLGHSFVGTEHILLSIVLNTECFASKLLVNAFKVNLNELKNKILASLKGNGNETNIDNDKIGKDSANQIKSTLNEKLLAIGSDITLKAKEKKIDPIIGRDKEMERVIEILCRKTKNNPVLIGEAGVGKTAIIEGLAQKIVNGDVPELLLNKTIYSLEIGNLMAGTKYRGAMEEKLKDVIETIIADKNIIVFIDEIHTLAQAGSEKGETSPADMLKPYLARGELQTIGATTTDEYRKYIEKDKALERRFQPIMVNPPSQEETILILKGLRDSFEAFHKIIVTDEAINSAVKLSDRYIVDRSLPDKAIDLIDEASSRAKVNYNLKPKEVKDIEDEIKVLMGERDEASMQHNYEKAAKIQTEISKKENSLTEINEKLIKSGKRGTNSIGEKEIAEVVSKWTGIPVTKITETEKDRLLKLEDILHKRVVGQNEAVTAVAKAIRRARVGIADSKRPIGSFIFLGPTGVGKTELCKAIAEAMFDDENNIIRMDMSEYMESHSVAKMIGAPPGYVGHEDGGQLTEAVRRKPYSVVLFDEIEKAHQYIFHILLQILEAGRLTDSQGRIVNFKNTIIILTSNIGSVEAKNKQLGFGEHSYATDFEDIKRIYLDALKKKFRPELLNRIDVMCVFKALEKQDLKEVLKIMVENLQKRLTEQRIKLNMSDNALNFIVSKCEDSDYGARPLKRYLQQHIEDKIADGILMGTFEVDEDINIDSDGTDLFFNGNAL